MSTNKLFAALITGALLATTAYAADEKKAADAAPAATDATSPPAKSKAKPHNHMTDKGMGTASEPGKASGKKPLHDHNKEHKQQ